MVSDLIVVVTDANHGGTQLIHGREDVSIEALELKEPPKTFSVSMVEAAVGPTHRAGDFDSGAEPDDSTIFR